MRHLFFFCFAVFLAAWPSVGVAQEHIPEETVENDDLVRIFDRFGDTYSLGDVRIPRERQVSRSSGEDCIPCGFFDLFFEEGSGFENEYDPLHQERREVLCQVFIDLTHFIQGADENQRVNIWVRNPEAVDNDGNVSFLAAATAFYIVPVGVADISGIIEGAIWRTINSGHDAYENVAAPLLLPPSSEPWGGVYYHGMITFNFNAGNPFHTDLSSNTPAGYYDMYTAALHEATHALDFASLINGNGESKFGSAFDYYTRYDQYLESANGDPLIQSDDLACPLYNFGFNPGLEPAIDILQPEMYGECDDLYGCNYCFDTDCALSVRFGGSIDQAVYTPNCYLGGSSLSHLDDPCHVPNAYPPSEYYVMAYAVDTGPNYQKRAYTSEERDILCSIGYTLNDQFGNNSNLNYVNYGGGMCSGIQVAGTHDGLNPDGTYQYATNPGETIYICTSQPGGILENDFNATSAICRELIVGSGTLSSSGFCGGSSIQYTPDEPGIHVIRYIPKNGNELGNITYILVYVDDPFCAESCDMLANGGFENTTDGEICEYALVGELQCWRYMTRSPDLFGRDCEEHPAQSIPLSGSFSDPAGVDTWDDGGNGENNRFVLLRGNSGQGPGNIWEESIQGRLSSPISPGLTYTVGFWARIGDGVQFTDPPIDGTITICGETYYPKISCSECEYTPSDYDAELISFTIPYDAQNNDWQYISGSFTYEGTEPLHNFIIGNNATENADTLETTGIFIDDVTLTPELPPLTLPSPLCIGNVIDNLNGFAPVPGGVFSGPGVSPDGDNFVFTATTAGTFTITYDYLNPNNPLCPLSISTEIVVQDEVIPTVNVTADPGTLVCPGGSTTLTASGAADYSWNPSLWLDTDTGPVVVASPEASSLFYEVTGTDANGCWNTAEIEISLDAFSVEANPSNTICAGSPVTLTASGGTGFTWSPAVGLNITTGAVVVASPTVTTTYTVDGITDNGCAYSTEITVFVEPNPVLSTDPDPTICEEESVMLCVEGAVTYSWTPGSSLNIDQGDCVIATPEETTTYTVTGTVNGCTSSAQVTVNVNPLPHPYIEVEPEQFYFCIDDAGDPLTLTGFGGVTYYWFSPISAGYAVQEITVPDETTEYCMNATVDGCTEMVCITIEVQDYPEVSFDAVPPSCGNADGIITVVPENGSNFTYDWDDPGLPDQATITGLEGGYYTVTVTNQGGCSQSFQYFLNSTVCCGFSASGVLDEGCRCFDPASIDVSAVGGEPFSYNWEGPGGFTATTEDVDNLYMEGDYYVTVTNVDGCEEYLSFAVAYPCAADFNCDGLVNVSDITSFLTAYGNNCGTSYECPEYCCYDLNQDCYVNTADLNLLLGVFGLTCAEIGYAENEIAPSLHRDELRNAQDLLAQNGIELQLTPNPTSGDVLLEISGLESAGATIQVVDQFGRTVHFDETAALPRMLDLKVLPAGLYFVRVRVGGVLFTDKLIVI